jgi:4-hydroxybenzoyl-CoA thioesterase
MERMNADPTEAMDQPCALRNEHRVHVLWPDCDPAGILFYGHYFRWMDDATYFLFERAGLRKTRLMADYGVPGIPLVSAHADFRSPARFGEVLTVESHVSQCGTRSFTVTHVFREGERVTAEGWEKRIWCKADPADPARLTPLPVPAEVRAALGVA